MPFYNIVRPYTRASVRNMNLKIIISSGVVRHGVQSNTYLRLSGGTLKWWCFILNAHSSFGSAGASGSIESVLLADTFKQY